MDYQIWKKFSALTGLGPACVAEWGQVGNSPLPVGPCLSGAGDLYIGAMATYDFKCDLCGRVEEFVFPMAQEKKTAECRSCKVPMRQVITGGQRTIFKGSGWTPKFSKGSPPPYDPEQDCESVDRQRQEAGLEPNPWKPTKAVHPIRSSGIETKKTE